MEALNEKKTEAFHKVLRHRRALLEQSQETSTRPFGRLFDIRKNYGLYDIIKHADPFEMLYALFFYSTFTYSGLIWIEGSDIVGVKSRNNSMTKVVTNQTYLSRHRNMRYEQEKEVQKKEIFLKGRLYFYSRFRWHFTK